MHNRTQCTGTHHSSAERASLAASSTEDKVQSPHTGVQGKKQLGARVSRGAVDGAQSKQGSALGISGTVEGPVHKIGTRPKQSIQCQRPTALEQSSQQHQELTNSPSVQITAQKLFIQ